MGTNQYITSCESAVCDLQTEGEAVSIPDPRRWYVVKVHTCREEVAADFLLKMFHEEEERIKKELEKADPALGGIHLLKSRLKRLGSRCPVTTFVPLQTYYTKEKGRIKENKKVVLFSRILLHIEPKELFGLVNAAKAVSSSLIKGLMYMPGTKIPAVIPEDQFQKFKYILGYTDSELSMTDECVRTGAKVRVVRGDLKGTEGFVRTVPADKKKARLGVEIDLLGSVCVDIPLDDLEFVR